MHLLRDSVTRGSTCSTRIEDFPMSLRMSDSESEMPHRQEYPHVTGAQRATLEKINGLLGEEAFDEFPSLTVEQQ